MTSRRQRLERQTKETQVVVELDLDGHGMGSVDTGIPILDHLVEQIARHGAMDLTIKATADVDPDGHHTAEDVALVLGRAFRDSLGEKIGIRRMGHAVVPLDEALVLVAVDMSGRGYGVVSGDFGQGELGGLRIEVLPHLIESLAREGQFAVHIVVLSGKEPHHIWEAAFKALARALRDAVGLDPAMVGEVPSTKGTLQS